MLRRAKKKGRLAAAFQWHVADQLAGAPPTLSPPEGTALSGLADGSTAGASGAGGGGGGGDAGGNGSAAAGSTAAGVASAAGAAGSSGCLHAVKAADSTTASNTHLMLFMKDPLAR